MKILSLNYQGLGIPEAVKELHYLASEEGPKVFYFFYKSETRLDRDGLTSLMKKSRLNKGFAVPRIELGGRLALLWWPNLFSKSH